MSEKEDTRWELKSRRAGFLVFLALIFAGVCIGLLLQWLMAPHSQPANVISMLMLPISVGIGAVVWQFIISIYIGIKIGRSFLKGFKKGGIKAAFQQKTEGFPPFPPGTIIFVFVSSVVCLIAGVAVASMPGVSSFFGTVSLYFITGIVYGLLQRHLVRSGYIIMFEEGPTGDRMEKDEKS